MSRLHPLKAGVFRMAIPMVFFGLFVGAYAMGMVPETPWARWTIIGLLAYAQVIHFPVSSALKIAYLEPKYKYLNAVLAALIVGSVVAAVLIFAGLEPRWALALGGGVLLSAVIGAACGTSYEPPYVTVHRLYDEAKARDAATVSAFHERKPKLMGRHKRRLSELIVEARRVRTHELEQMCAGWAEAYEGLLIYGLEQYYEGLHTFDLQVLARGREALAQYDAVFAEVKKKVGRFA